MYMYTINIYIYFFLVPVVMLRAVWWLMQGLLVFWITFHVKFPPLVLGPFLAFKLIKLSSSSRAASCHYWVLYRLRRHTSQAFWLDVLWLLAWQTAWGLLGWFRNVTSSRYQTSYILGLFNKRSFRRQIDNLSHSLCIFWGFGVMLFINVYWKHLFCERIKGLQKELKITKSAFSDALLMSRGKTAICTITHTHTRTHTHTHTHTHAQRVCVFVWVSVCLSVFVCVVNVRMVKSTTFVWLSCFQIILNFSVDSPTKKPRKARFLFFPQRQKTARSAFFLFI